MEMEGGGHRHAHSLALQLWYFTKQAFLLPNAKINTFDISVVSHLQYHTRKESSMGID